MKKIIILLIIFGAFLLFFNTLTHFDQQESVIKKDIINPKVDTTYIVDIPTLEPGTYYFIIELSSREGILQPEYEINIKTYSDELAWGKSGKLYSAYPDRKDELIKKAIYSLDYFSIQASGSYNATFKITSKSKKNKIDYLVISLNKK